MANIHDYLRWRGDILLNERSFNDADNVILSALAYLDFTDIVPGVDSEEGILLRDACQRLLDVSQDNVEPYVRSIAKIDTSFVMLLASSRRFANAVMRGYVDVVDPVRMLQFSALQIDLPTNQTYVAFRGTDSTLVGWREDFMLSFTVTESQHEACRYLEQALERVAAQGGTALVGGHSKGGILAEYAASCCPERLRSRIARVYSNDGPCLAPEVMQGTGATELGGRLVRIVPSFSVVGMLFAQPDNRRIVVESSGSGIGQHDLTTWRVTPVGLQETPELSPDCAPLNRAIADWASDLSLEERERVTDEVFDALEAGGATTLAEVTSSRDNLRAVIAALDACDERTREVGQALIDAVVNSSKEAAAQAARETMQQWYKTGHEMAEGAIKYLQRRKAERDAARAEARRAEQERQRLLAQQPLPQALPETSQTPLLASGEHDST